MLPTKNKHVLFQEMKNNPVHLITEEDLKQVSILESVNTSKKDKKDERRRKATGNKLLLTRFKMSLFVAVNFALTRPFERPFIWLIHL